jgi:NAD(P)H-dependent FMN reductase
MKIGILVGSSDRSSHSLGLGSEIQGELQKSGAEVTLLNLIEQEFPLYDRGLERADNFPQSIQQFLELSQQMDAFVWVTPIYHNSYSAMLKNAIDWQHKMKFHGKVVGLASNGGNRSPQAADQLALVARSQGYITVPKRVCTDESDYNEQNQLINEAIKQRVKDFSDQLVDITKRLAN